MEDNMRNYIPAFTQTAAVCGAVIAMFAVTLSPSEAAKAKKASTDSTYTIRERCVAKAQAAYPDNGMGTASVMTQRTGIYADCAKSHGIRP
jgi:hypothetical protein